jgi:hypothetical protein
MKNLQPILPHPKKLACPTLPGCFNNIPPEDTALAKLPFMSKTIAPTVSIFFFD